MINDYRLMINISLVHNHLFLIPNSTLRYYEIIKQDFYEIVNTELFIEYFQ